MLILGRRLRFVAWIVVGLVLISIVAKFILDPGSAPASGPFSTPIGAVAAGLVILLAGILGYGIKVRSRRTSLVSLMTAHNASFGFRALLTESTYGALKGNFDGWADRIGAVSEMNVIVTAEGLEIFVPLSLSPQRRICLLDRNNFSQAMMISGKWSLDKHVFVSAVTPPDLEFIVLKSDATSKRDIPHLINDALKGKDAK